MNHSYLAGIALVILLMVCMGSCVADDSISVNNGRDSPPAVFRLQSLNGSLMTVSCSKTGGSLGLSNSYLCTVIHETDSLDQGEQKLVVARGFVNIPESARLLGFAIVSMKGSDLDERPVSFKNRWVCFYVDNNYDGSVLLRTDYWEDGAEEDPHGWGLIDWYIDDALVIGNASLSRIDEFEIASISSNLQSRNRSGKTEIIEISRPEKNIIGPVESADDQ